MSPENSIRRRKPGESASATLQAVTRARTGGQAEVEVIINLPAVVPGTDFTLCDTLPQSLTREGLVKRLAERLSLTRGMTGLCNR